MLKLNSLTVQSWRVKWYPAFKTTERKEKNKAIWHAVCTHFWATVRMCFLPFSFAFAAALRFCADCIWNWISEHVMQLRAISTFGIYPPKTTTTTTDDSAITRISIIIISEWISVAGQPEWAHTHSTLQVQLGVGGCFTEVYYKLALMDKGQVLQCKWGICSVTV